MTTPDYPDWQTPQAHATAISVTGAPLLVLTSIVTNTAPTVIAAGATLTLGPFAINQIGYEVDVSQLTNAASTTPFMDVVLTWQESSTGLIVGRETWRLAGSNAAAMQYRGEGKTKGNQVTIAITNLDALAQTVGIIMLQNSRVYGRDRWYNVTFTSIPSLTRANATLDSNLLFDTGAVNVPATSNVDRIIPLYCGQIQTVFTCQTANGQLQIVSTLVNVPSVYIGPVVTGGTSSTPSVNLPRCLCTVRMINPTAGAAVYQVTGVLTEQGT